MTDRAAVSRWLAGYEAAWRAPGTGSLTEIFAADASYHHGPYEKPVVGLDAIGRMWDEERAGPDEAFTLNTEILAVDGSTAVVRADVRYGDPVRRVPRDLWVMRLGEDGRCSRFRRVALLARTALRGARAGQLSRPGQDGDRGAGGVPLHPPPGPTCHSAASATRRP